jgi:aquaporin Z
MEKVQKYLAEFIGTFILVGIGLGTLLGLVAMDTPDLLAIALAFGLAWMAGLYAVGRISDGHFNPAISVGMFLDKRLSPVDLVGYIVAQLAGAIGAVVIFAWLTEAGRAAVYSLAAVPSESLSNFKAFSVEAILVLILVLAFLTLEKSQAHTKYIGMGATLAAVTLLGTPFTGAVVNPARWLAPILVGDYPMAPGLWGTWWVYLGGALVGAIAGWVIYKVVVTGDTNLMDDVKEMM